MRIVAYRTISYEVAEVLARVPSIDLLAYKRCTQFETRKNPTTVDIYQWRLNQQLTEEKGKHVHCTLILEHSCIFENWIRSTHGTMITGHGCINEYLCRIG